MTKLIRKHNTYFRADTDRETLVMTGVRNTIGALAVTMLFVSAAVLLMVLA